MRRRWAKPAEMVFDWLVGWLARLLTDPVKGLENYQELFAKLTNGNGAVKVFCEVAAL